MHTIHAQDPFEKVQDAELRRERERWHRANLAGEDTALTERAKRLRVLQGGGQAEGTDRLAEAVYDVNDLDQIPQPEPLISGVLDVRTLAMVSGKFGTYKSFLLLSWAGHLATGQDWAGHHVPQPVPVLYVAAEGVGGFQGRMAAWRQRFGEIPRGMLTVVGRPVRLNVAEDVAWLRAMITKTGALLVIIDTLHRSAPGVDENSAKEMGEIVEAVATLRDGTGATMLFAHHTGHAGQRSRGSSVNEDDIDTSFVIKLGNGEAEDRSPDTPRTLEHRKSKDAELLPPVGLALYPVEGTGSAYVEPTEMADREATAAARVAHLVAVADRLSIPWNAGREKILDAFARAMEEITRDQAAQVAKVRKARGKGAE